MAVAQVKGKFVTNYPKLDKKWYIIDAEGKTLGKLAVKIADTLRGKNKSEFSPHIDNGDYIVVINAEKVNVTGKKETDKKYYYHTGYPGGLKERTFAEYKRRGRSIDIIKKAVSGMMPKNRLARDVLKKLKVYEGAEHSHSAQNPEVLN